MVNFMRQFRNTPREDNGFVIVTALMVIFLTISIVATVAAVTASDVKSSARARTIIKTRFVAETASDAVYALIAREKNGYIAHAVQFFSVDPSVSPYTEDNNPLFQSTQANPGFGKVWFYFGDGRIIKCDDADTEHVCFVARMTQTTSSVVRNEEVVLDVIARGGCTATGPPAQPLKNCIYRSFQQVFSTRTYVDQALIAGSNSGGVVGGYNVAYIPSDKIVGTVHTNADSIKYCGDIDQGLEFTSEGGSAESASDDFGATFCGTDLTPPSGAVKLPQFLPGQIGNTGKNVVNNSLIETSVFKALAGGGTPPYSRTGNTDIELFPSGIKFGTSAEIAYPPNGVIYVQGTATVKGKFSRGLSIYATSNVTISGNIEYQSLNGDMFNGFTGTEPPPDVILGIATAGDIVLECGTTFATPTVAPECPNRNVVAVLDAPNGRVMNNNWATAKVSDDPPEFVLYGSIISYYHPVFGSYLSVPSDAGAPAGTLENGWAKTITYDPRLADQQPPYFFRTSQANVVRSTLDESACKPTVVYATSGVSICT
ncbi:MAG TPA: hypothetical protein PKB15_06255 [Acidimicrobiia bacterium]|nr:hypothetical protein [Acidimicrobiia bacterium]